MKNNIIFGLLIFMVVALNSCAKDASTTPVVNTPDTTFTPTTSGNFIAQNGYQASGQVQLGSTKTDAHVLRLAPNFAASLSTGAVTLYLSEGKDLTLAQTATHQRISLVTKPGEQLFVLQNMPKSTFKYAILWCAGAGVQFGFAELGN